MTGAPLALVPIALTGVWTLSPDGACADKAEFEFTGKTAEIRSGGSVNCRYAGVRSLNADRWYVDLRCDDGSLVQLDILQRDADTLLIALRPLGEAHAYRRCGLS